MYLICTYSKVFVVKSPIPALLKEVGVTIFVLKCIVNVAWNSLPILDRFWIRPFHWRPLFWVEPVVLVSLIENTSVGVVRKIFTKIM